jgi:hypothetical protein
LHNEKLHILFSIPNVGRSNQGKWVRRDKWHAWERKVYRGLVQKPEGKRPLGRLRRRWEDGVWMFLRETGWGGGGVDPVGWG